MHYATYGRTRRRPNRRVASANKHVQRPSAHQTRLDHKMESKDKKLSSSFNSKRRSDPDGAYCVSREEHSNNVKNTQRRHDSRGKQRMSTVTKEKTQPSFSSAAASSAQRKSGAGVTSRQSRSKSRSPSPIQSRTNSTVSKPRSSSSRPSRSRSESFNEKRQRSSSLKSCRSSKSCKSAKSEAPTLSNELTGFDLKTSNKMAAQKKPGTKNFLINKISGFSILGGCKKKPQSRHRPMPRNARDRGSNVGAVDASTSALRSRRYQLEDMGHVLT